MSGESIEITRTHVALIESVIELAIQYEDMMDHKRKLGNAVGGVLSAG